MKDLIDALLLFFYPKHWWNSVSWRYRVFYVLLCAILGISFIYLLSAQVTWDTNKTILAIVLVCWYLLMTQMMNDLIVYPQNIDFDRGTAQRKDMYVENLKSKPVYDVSVVLNQRFEDVDVTAPNAIPAKEYDPLTCSELMIFGLSYGMPKRYMTWVRKRKMEPKEKLNLHIKSKQLGVKVLEFRHSTVDPGINFTGDNQISVPQPKFDFLGKEVAQIKGFKVVLLDK